MSSITLQDKALAHLYKYNHINEKTVFDAPYEMTQDGVASVLGISRSHASILLGKMVNNELLLISHASVRGSKKPLKRMIYHVTEKGMKEYVCRMEALSKYGIEIETVNTNVNNFDEKDVRELERPVYDMIGCVCVLRKPVLKQQVPLETYLLPYDSSGQLILKDIARTRYISLGSEQDRRRWHSMAADWCMDNDDDMRERLFHLFKAGRDLEAVRLIKNNRYEVMDVYDRETEEIAVGLAYKHEEDIDLAIIAARLAITGFNFTVADHFINIVSEYDENLGGSMKAEVLLNKQQPVLALSVAKKNYRDDCDTGLVLGRCLIENGMLDEAKECLDKVKKDMIEIGCAFRIDELLGYEAVIENNLDHNEIALMLIDAAITTSKNEKRRSNLIALSNRIRSENGILLQCVDV